MIFTFGAPDLYVLPSDIYSTHSVKENKESEFSNVPEEQDILNIKISYCNSYIFILTKRVLFAYSNGNELLFLGRLSLSEAGFTEFGNFRDLVILPVSNFFGLLVDNAKHLLIVNYQNPNLSESIANTPVQTPTNRALYDNADFNSDTSLNSNQYPTYIGSTPLATTPVATANNNTRFSTTNLVNILNRIFLPSDEEVEELRDSFDIYLKNFVKFRLVYDILVPSNFSFMFVVGQQFVFWTKEFSGLYSTISKDGFLNLLIDDFSSFKRRVAEVKRMSLYLLTTNLLNNVNIIGNIPLSYGLCYINLQSVAINSSRLLQVDYKNKDNNTRSSNGDNSSRSKEDNENEKENNKKDNNKEGNEKSVDYYRNYKVHNDNDSLFQMIYQCVKNIHNTDPNNLVSSSSNNSDRNGNEGLDSLENKGSVDSENILDLLEVQNKSVGSAEDCVTQRTGGVEENLVKNVRNHFIVGNKLYLLSSDLLLYFHINSPQYYENEDNNTNDTRSSKEENEDKEKESNKEIKEKTRNNNGDNNENTRQNTSINSFVTACSREYDDNKSSKRLELGRLVYEDVEEVYVNKENEFLCVLFKGNKLRTFYLKRLDRPISELELEEEVGDVCWSNNFLIVLTVNNYLHFYSYSLQKLYSTPVDPTKKGTNQRSERGIGTIRTFSNLSNTSLTNSETCSTYRSVVSVNSKESEDTSRSNGDSTSRSKEDTEKDKDNNKSNKNFKKGRLLGINNNLKLLVYNRRLVVYNLYVNHSNVGDFNLFLNSNNILIISSSSFFSPTKSFETTFNTNLSKDKRQMFTLKLPNPNSSEKEYSEGMDEDQPCSMDELLIKDIKINKTANYILIHHASSGAAGAKSNSGIILYDNHKYTFSNNNNVEVLAINWFTNHIFYLVVSIKDEKQMAERKRVPFKYYVSFYSINNMTDVLIDIPMKDKPVCTTTDNPYLFIALDESNKLHCYDLFYIQYKMLYTFNLNELSWCSYWNDNNTSNSNKENEKNKEQEKEDKENTSSKEDNENENREDKENKEKEEKTKEKEEEEEKFNVKNHGEYWKEIYVFGFKKFLLLDLYRELYLVDEHQVGHLLSDVNQVVFNVSDSSNYQYLVTTRDGRSYLLSNYSENMIKREYSTSKSNSKENTSSSKEDNEKENQQEKEENTKENNKEKKEYSRNKSTSKTNLYSGGKNDKYRPMFAMEVVELLNNTNHILNINNDVIVLLNLTKNNISLIYTLLPVFLTESNSEIRNDDGRYGLRGHEKYVDDFEPKQLRGREMLLLEYLIHYFNVLGKDNNNTRSSNKENSSSSKEENNDDEDKEMENKEDEDEDEDKGMENNTNKTEKEENNNTNKNKDNNKENNKCKEMMSRISKMMKNKLFSISCRKQNELENVMQLEKQFDLKSEECFNYLLEEKEFEFASLLLLPLQIKTDPYYVRAHFCKDLIRELLSSIIRSTPQTGFKSRRNNQLLILMLIKFYNRLPMGNEDNNSSKEDSEQEKDNNKEDDNNGEKEDKEAENEEKEDSKTNNEEKNQENTRNSTRDNKEEEELLYKIRSLGFGKGIDMVINMNELIEDLLLKLNFMPVYQLNFLDYKNKDNNTRRSKEENNGDSKDKEPMSPTNYPNYLNSELKDIIENIVKLNTDFKKLALNIVLYFMVESNHINYDMFTTSTGKSPEFLVNKFFTEENMRFYMLLGYSNYICLSDLVVSNPYITNFMIKIQESNCRIDDDPSKEELNILKNLLVKTISTYTTYPN